MSKQGGKPPASGGGASSSGGKGGAPAQGAGGAAGAAAGAGEKKDWVPVGRKKLKALFGGVVKASGAKLIGEWSVQVRVACACQQPK